MLKDEILKDITTLPAQDKSVFDINLVLEKSTYLVRASGIMIIDSEQESIGTSIGNNPCVNNYVDFIKSDSESLVIKFSNGYYLMTSFSGLDENFNTFLTYEFFTEEEAGPNFIINIADMQDLDDIHPYYIDE